MTVDATGEAVHITGYIHLENPLGGSKTISSSGGKIVWRGGGTITIADAGTKFEVGLQEASTTASPSQGDGTFVVSTSYTAGTGGISSGAWNQSAMSTGSKTINHGDLISIVFAMTTRAGSDTVSLQVQQTGSSVPSLFGSVVANNTTGTMTASTSLPLCYIIFDDGTVGYMDGIGPHYSNTSYSINLNSATADEYGNYINVPYTFNALGIKVLVNVSANSSDFELILYSDPFGTPSAQRTLTIDATQIAQTGNSTRLGTVPFAVPYLVKANTPIAITARPTTTNSMTLYGHSSDGIKSNRIMPPNDYVYAVRRINNSGAFSDYSTKSVMVTIYLYGYYVEQGVNNATYQLGI
ncbi:hypothetical protein R2083_08010 [Nitrosomonas sp. Is35]|uniref:hypothetical protein n=1 Tax=Nitrosomonas sp. Is35 TaxID=3080534 RepID=UPI00294B67F9|nr:hypothetical protein [Nitrosomonas sp. Is35]MDV6347457.1 hypothetical protein [Nitrosomonas sp. Is35]